MYMLWALQLTLDFPFSVSTNYAGFRFRSQSYHSDRSSVSPCVTIIILEACHYLALNAPNVLDENRSHSEKAIKIEWWIDEGNTIRAEFLLSGYCSQSRKIQQTCANFGFAEVNIPHCLPINCNHVHTLMYNVQFSWNKHNMRSCFVWFGSTIMITLGTIYPGLISGRYISCEFMASPSYVLERSAL